MGWLAEAGKTLLAFAKPLPTQWAPVSGLVGEGFAVGRALGVDLAEVILAQEDTGLGVQNELLGWPIGTSYAASLIGDDLRSR